MGKKRSVVWFLIGAVSGSASTLGVVYRSKIFSMLKKKPAVESTES